MLVERFGVDNSYGLKLKCSPTKSIWRATGGAGMDEELYARGMKVRRAVLGDAHVDRATQKITPFDRDFQDYITKHAWGAIWDRPGLERRVKHLITITLMAALGHEEELAMHLRATRQTGVTADEVKEALMHVAVYAGVPTANVAFRIAKTVFAELEQQP
jgi:4-carboxymuconolactone decarboxylase